MSDSLHRMKVVIEANNAKLKQAMHEATSIVDNTMSRINGRTSDMQMIRNMANGIKKSWNDMINGTIPNRMMESMRDYVREAQLAAGIRVYNPEYDRLCDAITKAEEEESRLVEKMNSMDASKRYIPTQEFKDLEREIVNAGSSIEKLQEKQKKLETTGKATVPTEIYAGWQNNLKNLQGELEGLKSKRAEWRDIGFTDDLMGDLPGNISQLEGQVRTYEELMAKAREAGTDTKPTREYAENAEKISAMRQKLQEYISLRDQMVADGSNVREAENFQRIGLAIDDARKKLNDYRAERSSMEQSGADIQTPTLAGGSVFATAGATARAAFSDMAAGIREAQTAATAAIQEIPVVGQVASSAAYLGSSAFNGMKAVMKGIAPAVKTASGTFGALIQKFVGGLPVIRRFTGGIKQNNNTIGSGVGKLLKYGLGIRSMYALFSKLRTAMTDGFKNLAKKNSETNANLSELSGGLQQLKNSLASAFSPILNTITPALSTLINYLVQACNVVGQFFAALTGQKTYTTASKVQKDYAASLDKTGNSASNAADKIKKSLMGFDEINKLDDDSKSSSGSSSGGDTGDFTENEVTNKYANFAQMIKDAWENADFTEIGKIAGAKLNAALENIPWEDIQNTCNRIAKSVATFLNGFMEETDWNLVGKTIANGVNTAIESASTFVTTFDWSKLGKSIGETVDSAIKNIKWSLLAKTLSDAAKGLLDAFCETMRNIDWQNVGDTVVAMLVSIDWVGILKRLVDAIIEFDKASIGFAVGIVTGLLERVPEAINDWIKEKKDECGGNLIGGIYEGIKDKLKDAYDWFKENVLKPITDAFKKAFGIHSPSTEFETLGGYCIDGLFEGLKKIPDLSEIAKNILSKIKEAWDKLTDKTLKLGADIKDGAAGLLSKIKDSWDKLKDKTVQLGADIKDGATGLWNNLKKSWGEAKTRALSVSATVKTKAKTLAKNVKSGWNKLSEGSKKVGLVAYVANSISTLANNVKDAWGSNRTVPLHVQIENMNQIKQDVQNIIDPLGRVRATYTGTRKATGGVYSGGRWHNITAYASGGSPGAGQMFIAREAGPELVGTIGGHTAVMNNNQIVSSVAAGVYSAVVSAMKASGSSQSDPVFNIYVGGRKVTDVVIEEVNRRTKSTGACPILI